MALTDEFKELFGDWIASVARAVDAAVGRFVRSRRILLDESEDGTFTARAAASKNAPALSDISFRLDGGRPQPPLPADWVAAFRGSRVEAQLPAGHVMVCPLDFPAQAGDFLDGMIRAQIDRLTPWTVNDAVFGWSPPTTAANERIEVTFAATSKTKVATAAPVRPDAGCSFDCRIQRGFHRRRSTRPDQAARQAAAKRVGRP